MATNNAINNTLPSGVSVTGTTTINTSGAAVTTINTGGTGALNLGNATGNTAVTGSLTASTGLVATTGGITATGTSGINTSGSSVTTINTGGTGALNIGNATGNTAVTGSLTASTTLTATLGAITATAGNLVTTTGDAVLGNTASATTAPFVKFQKSRAGGVITTGDDLGELAFQGHDGTQYITASRIRSDSSGTIATNRIASNLEFYTHPDSTSASAIRMTIASTGAITIASPDSGVGLTVSGGGATVTSGDVTITSGNLAITAATTSSVGQITQAGSAIFHTYGAHNVYIGETSGNYTQTGNGGNVGLGQLTLNAITTGEGDLAIGRNSLKVLTTGNNNCFLGAESGRAKTTGDHDVGMGTYALYQLTTGADNVAVGYQAGKNYTSSESGNIVLGQVAGTTAESNVMRLGNDGSISPTTAATYIRGVSGVTVTGTAVLCSTAGQLGTVASSERFKENIQEMGSSSDKIMNLRPVTFNFKDGKGPFGDTSGSKTKQYGLIAEEVDKVMPDLVVYDDEKLPFSVKYHDLPALLLNEIQKLSKRIEFLEDQLKGKGML